MSRGSTTSEGSGGEGIQHFSTIRIRATGQGQLKMVAFSLDYIKKKDLVPLPLAAMSRIQPNRIVNFVEQRACFELYTTDANEYVRINRIIVFMKEIYSSTPGA
jgi:hypothetical protein